MSRSSSISTPETCSAKNRYECGGIQAIVASDSSRHVMPWCLLFSSFKYEFQIQSACVVCGPISSLSMVEVFWCLLFSLATKIVIAVGVKTHERTQFFDRTLFKCWSMASMDRLGCGDSRITELHGFVTSLAFKDGSFSGIRYMLYTYQHALHRLGRLVVEKCHHVPGFVVLMCRYSVNYCHWHASGSQAVTVTQTFFSNLEVDFRQS